MTAPEEPTAIAGIEPGLKAEQAAPRAATADAAPTAAREPALNAAPALNPTDGYPYEPIPDTRPLSPAAKRAIGFALLPFAVNVVSNVIVRIADPILLSGTSSDPWYLPLAIGENAVFIVSRLLDALLLILAFWYGYTGLRETKDGTLRGRTRATWAIILAYGGAVLLLVGIVFYAIALLSGAQQALP